MPVDEGVDDGSLRLAAAVKDARLTLGWSKEEAARRAGISSITWKKVEDGKPVQEHKLKLMADVLGWASGEVFRIKGGAVAPTRDDARFVSHPTATAAPDVTWSDEAIELEISTVREHLERVEMLLRERRRAGHSSNRPMDGPQQET